MVKYFRVLSSSDTGTVIATVDAKETAFDENKAISCDHRDKSHETENKRAQPKLRLFVADHHVQNTWMATLRFCQECNNLLYPKADPQRRVMVYACRICAYDELGENSCVYRNDLLTVTKEKIGVTTDLGADPTLPHSNIECPKCGGEDAVFFQDQSKRRETRMILFYVCTKCDHAFTDPNLQSDAVDIVEE